MSIPTTGRLFSIPDETTARSLAYPLTLSGTNGAAVLLIHGFTGIVDDMKYLGIRLSEAGYTVSVPRLPGHGTNHQDFLAVSWRDWLRRCYDEYIDLSARFEKVYVAGLSMGGLLAALVAAQFKPKRIALAAPAFAASNRLIRLTPFMRYFLTSVADPKSGQEPEPDPDKAYLESEYRAQSWVGPIAELRHLQRIAARRLRLIEAPTLTIVSKADRTVPTRVADLIESKIQTSEKRRVVLETSAHVVVNDTEKEQVADEIIEWFKR